MRTEYREITNRYPVFIAIDGTEFPNQIACLNYEKRQIVDEQDMLRTAVEMRDGYDEEPTTLYHIQNESQWNFLCEYEWLENHYSPRGYPGPGYYLAIRHDGGDYVDYYTIKPAIEYAKEIMHEAEKYYDNILQNIKNIQESENLRS